MEARYQVTEEDYVGSQALFSRLTSLQRNISAAIVVLLLLLVFVASGFVKGGAIGAIVGGALVYVSARYIFNPIIAKRQYRKHKALHDEFSVSLSEDGVEFRGPNGYQILKWEHILKWKHDDNMLLIYQSPRLYHLVPKRLDSPEFTIAVLVKRLEEKVGDAI